MKKARFIAAILAGLWSSIAMQVFAIDVDRTDIVSTTWCNNNNVDAPYANEDFAPMVTTRDGRTIEMAENYMGILEEETGIKLSQTLTGLETGLYTVELYANAAYTPGRGIDDILEDGAEDVAYVFANDEKVFVKAVRAESVDVNGEYTIADVMITDGTLTLGIATAKPGTNWHTIQIKSLTFHQTTDEELLLTAKSKLQALIDKAIALSAEEFADAIAKAQNVYDTATDYNTIVDATDELQNIIAEKEEFCNAQATLKALIDKATTLSAEEFADAIAKAQNVYDNATDYEAIVEAINELQDTIAEKEVFWDAKVTLKALIDQADTSSIRDILSDAIAKAQNVYDTATDYNAIVDATNELQYTIDETTSTGYFLKEGHLIVLADIQWNYPWESQRNEITSVEFRDGVTLVGYAAFEGCENLTSITIPASVTSINAYAFKGCISLSTVTIPEDSKLTSIGYEAFNGCNNLTSINIPASVTSIEGYAFWGCKSLSTVTIPEDSKLTSIGDCAFYECKNLTSINIPANVNQIGHGAFFGCISLSTVTIPEDSKLTSIGGSAFQECRSLSSITIPSGVTSIGSEAFRECHQLSSITIPDGVTSIGFATFWNCISLTNVNISEQTKLTSIGDEAFYCCKELSSITIPDKITSIERSTFRHCSSLTTVNISEGSKLTLIGDWAFEGCANLSSITIPNGVTSIGESAFSGCSSLTTVNISEESKLALIKNYTFMGCSNLSSITIPKEVTSIGYGTFVNCSSLTTVMIPEDSKLTSLDYAFNNCSSLSSITIPASVTSIGAGTFANCSSLTTVMIPEDSKLTSIGRSAFDNCYSLSSITIPKEVTSIDEGAFLDCSHLSTVTIPKDSKLISIGELVFYRCSNLSSITLPANINRIGRGAFEFGVETVFLNTTTPPTLTTSALIDDYGLFVVPESAYDDYCSADYWKDEILRNKIATQEAYKREVTLTANNEVSALYEALGETTLSRVADLTINGSINSHDFFMMLTKMTALRHLDLTNASIVYNKRTHYADCHTEDNIFPAYGLYNCNLLSLKLPRNITSIGNEAVYGNHIKTLEIPEGVTSIGIGAFFECRKLTSISIPKSVTWIGHTAFVGCQNLTSITLPPSVEGIEWQAFLFCSSLREVRLPSSIRYIGESAFEGCTSLTDIYTYTVEPIAIGQNTFPKYGNNFIGTLHAPKVSYANYYNDTQWGQFLSFEEFDEPYENFYLVGDKTLNENTGSINGTEENAPDAEMGENSGIIVEDDVEQDLGDVEIEHNGTDGGSIIVGGEGCVNADKLHFHINVQGGRWYFFCFPFDVKREDIKMENGADWVFRYYDGEERAANGQGGWKNVTSDGNGNHLKAATGYIFQCSQDDVLILTAKNQKLKQEKKYNELVEHLTENMQDASWNFVGNPYLSYYEVTSDDYSAPITVWRDGQYVAIRPGDDDYQLAPFEAFFVQKPTGVDEIEYSPEQQMTYHQAQEAAAKARARRREMPINPERLLVNITLTDGTNTDRTRVVFNNDADMGYETTCDAAKFSTAGIPQLYTIDSRAVKYAINERPVAEGIVTMGYTAPAQGNYTLAAPRMDTPIYVKDNLTGTIHDFSEGSYTFMTEAGTYEGRFTIMMKAGETAIDNSQMTIDNGAPTYNVKGQRVENATEQGIYIKDNRKVVKL